MPWPYDDDIINIRRVTQPRRPWDERLPDGRSVAEALGGLSPSLPAPRSAIPATGYPAGPAAVPTATMPQIHLGAPVANSGSLADRLANLRALRGADPSVDVQRTPWGYEEVAPTREHPSRLRQALAGALQGAALGGQGGAWQALGGALTGAAAGGISPRLMQALARKQEVDRLTGEVGQEQQIALRNAQIGTEMAQGEYAAARPSIELSRIYQQQQEAEERARIQREEEAGRNRRGAATITESAATRAERERHNRAMEGKPTGSNERNLNGAIYRKDENGIWQLAPGSPAPRDIPSEKAGEKATERSTKSRQAAALYSKGADYWQQAQSKRREADQLGSSPTLRITNKERIDQLNREAAALEKETRDVQQKGDLLAAEGESGPAASSSGRTIEGAIEAFKRKLNRAPTQAEIDRMKAALGQ